MKHLSSLLFSWKMSFGLLIAYAATLAAATFVEKFFGTTIALSIYHSVPLGIIWILLIINSIGIFIRKYAEVKGRWGMLIMHLSFIFIMTGAYLSHLYSFEGIMHLREGESENSISTEKKDLVKLPFSIYLDKFQVERYPGSNSPSSFKSYVTINHNGQSFKDEIYMNKVLKLRGYRIYQTSYDTDENGTFLTISHNLLGASFTNIGYFLLFLGIILFPFERKSRLRCLLRQLRNLSVMLLFLVPASSTLAQVSWDKIQVQSQSGRIEPMDTYCRELLRKIYHKENIDDKQASEIILDLLINPHQWNDRRILYQPNKELQQTLGIKGDYMSLNQMFDSKGNYILSQKVNSIYATPIQERSKFQKDILKLDEKVNILMAIEEGKMLPLFPLPGDKQKRWFSPGDDLTSFQGEDSIFVSSIMAWYIAEPNQEAIDMIKLYQQKKSNATIQTENQIKLELLYNRLRPFFWSAMCLLTLGLLLIINQFQAIVRGRSRSSRFMEQLLSILVIILFMVVTSAIGIRWYIAGQAPWSNAYESMIYAAWCTLAGGMLFFRLSKLTLALATFFSGVMLLVANMNWMDPSITPLVPVLQSYWLMIHVAVIIGGYGFFGLSFLISLCNILILLLKPDRNKVGMRIRELHIINEITLIIGLCLMTAGTFLGAIWANESWGRYWGWDPKETWALITVLVYTIVVHSRFIRSWNKPIVLSILSIIGFATVLMTYFGVTFWLTGLHSYGNN